MSKVGHIHLIPYAWKVAMEGWSNQKKINWGKPPQTLTAEGLNNNCVIREHFLKNGG